MVLADSDGISRVPPYSGYWMRWLSFRLRDCHPLWSPFPWRSTSSFTPVHQSYNPSMQARWFGLFPFRSPLLGKSIFLSLPVATEMFQFTTSTFHSAMCSLSGPLSIKTMRFPHSEISGSKLTYSSPKHIGVRPVLHRLLVPRHSPYALIHLTTG